MISMLIYSCKQDEIELLKEASKETVAYLCEDSLEIVVLQKYNDTVMENISNIDIAFVDITNEQGVQVAKSLRKRFKEIEIVIISDNTISPMVYLTPDIRAASLLLKPLHYNEVQTGASDLFKSLISGTKDNEDYFVFESEKEKFRIPYSQIMFFEARNRRIYIRFQNKEYGVYETLDMLEGQLPEKFIRCHRSFIVNLAFITKVLYSKNSILLGDNIEIPLSRTYKNTLKELFKDGKNINHTYILTPVEFAVIEAGKDIQELFSIQEEVQIDEKMVLRALNHLYQQNLIVNTDQGSFALIKDLDKIMTIISQAKRIVLIRKFGEEGSSKAIYVGTELAVVEQSKTDIGAIRVSEILPEELNDFFAEDITDEKKPYKQVLDEEQLFHAAMTNLYILQGDEIDALGNVMLMVERINPRNGKVDCRLFDKQEKEERKQLYQSKEESQETIFEGAMFINKVVSMIEEDSYDIS